MAWRFVVIGFLGGVVIGASWNMSIAFKIWNKKLVLKMAIYWFSLYVIRTGITDTVFIQCNSLWAFQILKFTDVFPAHFVWGYISRIWFSNAFMIGKIVK